jgi:HK97 family phage major capsid protein
MSLELLVQGMNEHTEAIKQFRSEQKADFDRFGERLDKVEGKLNRSSDGGEVLKGAPRLLEVITKHAGFQGVRAREQKSSGAIRLPGAFNLIRKAVFSQLTGGSPGQSFDIPATRDNRIGEDARRPLRLLDRLPHLRINSNALEFQQLNSYVAQADYQSSEGATKSESDPPFRLETARILTIAHYVRASEQVLADAPMLGNYLSDLMAYGVTSKVEREVVSGANATRIEGLVTQATTYAPIAMRAPDQISEAAASLGASSYMADLVILHPNTWHRLRTERATDNQYVAGGWDSPASPTVWSLPIVTTPSLTAGQAIVLDSSAVAILDRMETTVEIGRNGNDMIENMVTILGETRVGFAAFSPSGILKLTLTF